MRLGRISSWLSMAAMGIVAAGCGSDDPTGPETEIQRQEALAIFSEVLAAVFTAGVGGTGSFTMADGASLSLAPTAPLYDVTTINESYACTGGGSIELTGSTNDNMNYETGTGVLDWQLTETPVNCGVSTASGSYVVNGSPNLQMSMSYSFTDFVLDGPMTMEWSGGLAWNSTGRGATGSCTIDLDYTFDMEAGSGSMVGQICGYTYDQQF
jgi:hypothetical protein